MKFGVFSVSMPESVSYTHLAQAVHQLPMLPPVEQHVFKFTEFCFVRPRRPLCRSRTRAGVRPARKMCIRDSFTAASSNRSIPINIPAAAGKSKLKIPPI